MANKIAAVSGLFSDGATWATADATSLLHSENSNTALTTSYVESATFTPGAITIDGIAVKIRSRAAVASGTWSVRLAQAGSLVAGTEVTVNVSDVNTDQTDHVGWFFFKFAAPVLLVGATLYTVSAKSSTGAQVTLYRSATSGDWSRMLRTTTTGAPAAGDDWWILGQWTAAATKTNVAVTMDITAATDYGSGSTTLTGAGIGNGGTLTFGTTASTNYILQESAILTVWYGGILNMGTVGTPCPRTSTMTLQFDCAVDGDFGLRVYGTWSAQGLSRTSGKNVVMCLLNANLSAAGTTLNVDTDTGWLNGDDIAIATTTRTATQGETRALNANAGASSMVVGSAVTNAHAGVSPTQAEVILLSRNVRVRAVTSTFVAYVNLMMLATVDCDWVEFRYLGTSSTPKRGIEISTSTGSVALSYCSIWGMEGHGLVTTSASLWNNLTIDNLTMYVVNGTNPGIELVATTGVNWSLVDVTVIGSTNTNLYGIAVATLGGICTRIRASGFGGSGCFAITGYDMPFVNTWSDFELHGGVEGMWITSAVAGGHMGTIRNVNAWRNTDSGIYITGRPVSLLFDGGNLFGNVSNAGYYNTPMWVDFKNFTFAGDTTFSSTYGVRFNQSNSYWRATFENCTFGVATGIKVAHTGGDIDNEATAPNAWFELTFINTNLASTTEFTAQVNMCGQSFLRHERVDQTTATHKIVWPRKGTVSYETTTIRTSGNPSEKLAPSGAATNNKLTTGIKRARINSGGTVAISAYVRKSSLYTGNAPRLIMKSNAALGMTADVVVATFSAVADTWQQLSGVTAAATEDGVVEFYVDCDGSAGNVYVTDWSAA